MRMSAMCRTDNPVVSERPRQNAVTASAIPFNWMLRLRSA